MDLGLTDRVVVVTGASKGIGLATVEAFVAEGAHVVAGALHGSPEFDRLAERGSAHPVTVDLSTADGPAALIAAAVSRFGAVDVLVNNVGAVTPRPAGFTAITDADWDRTFTLDFFAAVRAMRAAVPHLLARPGASIVTISSVNAFLPDPGVLDYSAAKAALTNVCKSLSKELAPHVRVNTVSPGPVQTDLWLGVGGVAATLGAATGVSPESIAAAAAAGAATGRFTRPDEVAAIAVFLAGAPAANITGSDVTVDGGLVPTL